jgi:hypothetical protein
MAVADAEGLNAPEGNMRASDDGEDAQVRRSPQAVACRKRDVKELGRPQRLLPVASWQGGGGVLS